MVPNNNFVRCEEMQCRGDYATGNGDVSLNRGKLKKKAVLKLFFTQHDIHYSCIRCRQIPMFSSQISLLRGCIVWTVVHRSANGITSERS